MTVDHDPSLRGTTETGSPPVKNSLTRIQTECRDRFDDREIDDSEILASRLVYRQAPEEAKRKAEIARLEREALRYAMDHMTRGLE